MKKLDKELYIKHAKRLGAIIDAKSTFAPFLTRKDFNSVLTNELNVLAACEKLFPNEKIEAKLKANALVKEFNTLTKGKFELNEKFKYEDETDLIDAINYLFTFCSNMFKVNLDDLIGGKKITATDPKIDLRAKPEFDNEGSRPHTNFAFAGAGIPLASTPYENPYIVGRAYAKIQDDMRNGKFYRYKTKPSIIPIVKWCAVIVTILISLSLILSAIFAFIANGITLFNAGTGTDASVNLVMNGVFYIVAAAFGAYPLYITMSTMLGSKGRNDNFKYFFNWGFILMFLILAVLFSLMDTITVWQLSVASASIGTTQETAYIGLKITLILILAFSGLDIICLIIGGVYNPKPDPEAIEKKVKEYIDLFSAESGQMPVPPKAEEQKPVKVTDTKKSKDKPKNDSNK